MRNEEFYETMIWEYECINKNFSNNKARASLCCHNEILIHNKQSYQMVHCCECVGFSSVPRMKVKSNQYAELYLRNHLHLRQDICKPFGKFRYCKLHLNSSKFSLCLHCKNLLCIINSASSWASRTVSANLCLHLQQNSLSIIIQLWFSLSKPA